MSKRSHAGFDQEPDRRIDAGSGGIWRAPGDHDALAARVETFVRETIVPYERDPRRDEHGPSGELVTELRAQARADGLMTPHMREDGEHLSQRATTRILRSSGLSPLGPVALNTMAPDDGNMQLLARVATPAQKKRFLMPLLSGEKRSAFFMSEPAEDGGAGSDPSMMRTTCYPDGGAWVIDGRKTFITGASGASVGIVMAKSSDGACLFLVDLPNPAIRIDRIIPTLDSAMPGGHAAVTITDLRVPHDQLLGEPGEGFKLAQLRLGPARLSHCMRWLGAATRAHEIATGYACRRMAFGKMLIDHEGVGFMLADNLIDLQQSELLIDWCADALDAGHLAIAESSMTKIAVSEALMRVADRCVQVMGGTGLSGDTVVEQIFREIRAFRIYDGPTEAHKWSLSKKIKRDTRSN